MVTVFNFGFSYFTNHLLISFSLCIGGIYGVRITLIEYESAFSGGADFIFKWWIDSDILNVNSL